MSPSLLLSAGLFLGQVVEAPHATQPGKSCACKNGGTVQTWGRTTTSSTTWSDDRPILSRIGDKIGGLFGKRTESQSEWRTVPAPISGAAPAFAGSDTRHPAAAPARKLPSRVGVVAGGQVTIETVEPDLAVPDLAVPGALKPTADLQPAAAPRGGLIREAFLAQIGHADDFTWITGQLHVEDGAPFILFAAAGSADRFGGKLRLYAEKEVSGFRPGDLIGVRGRIYTGEDRSVGYLANVIHLIERP